MTDGVSLSIRKSAEREPRCELGYGVASKSFL